jgi:hypothetical protein
MASYGSTQTMTRPQPAHRESGLAAKPGTLGAVARFWQSTYAPDYVSLVLLTTAYFMVRF